MQWVRHQTKYVFLKMQIDFCWSMILHCEMQFVKFEEKVLFLSKTIF